MKKCIIFGAGFYGNAAYDKLSAFYDVLYYVDNNSVLWGKQLHTVEIISKEELLKRYDETQMDLFICCRAYMDIFNDLRERGIHNAYAMVEGFLYYLDENMTPFPTTLQSLQPYKKERQTEKSILYVQNAACIRTHKIASVMKKSGWKVYLLYTMASPKFNNAGYLPVYDAVFPAFSADEITEFVNRSEFDIVHSSNEPDILTSILAGTNKKIVFDTHDMMSMCGHTGIEALTLEYIANVRSDGIMHVTEGCYDFAKRKYNIERKPYLCIGNYPQHQYRVHYRLDKLSKKDGELHCVYEGGMVFRERNNARYFKDIWKKITDEGIHIHFYTNANEALCREYEATSPFLHYEGNKGTLELIEEMTQYDCGLALFNINDENRALYVNSSQNKMYEYICAGLPIVSCDLKSYMEFIERYKTGIKLDMSQDIRKQIETAVSIKIEEDFLTRNKLTMEARAEEISQFYKAVMNT